MYSVELRTTPKALNDQCYVLERERMRDELLRAEWPSSEFEGNIDEMNDVDTLGGSVNENHGVRWKKME